MTSFYIDPDELAKAMQNEAATNKKDATSRAGKIVAAIGIRLMLNQNDPTVNAVEVLLGIKEGGVEKVAELLGFTAGSGQPRTPGALGNGSNASTEYAENCRLHNGEWIVPILNPDGSSTNDGHYESHLKSLGYKPHFNSEGKLDGYVKPPTATEATPAASSNDDEMVPLLNKKGGDTGRKIKVSEGKKNRDWMTNWSSDGTKVESFQELGLVRTRR